MKSLFLMLAALVGLFALLAHPALSDQEGDSAPPGQFDSQGKRAKATEVKAKAEEKADATPHFDAQGKKITAAEVKAATATAKACLELYNGPGVTWNIDVTYNPNSYPFVITGGSIKGTICDSPNWVVTGGTLGPNLTVNAKRTGGGGACANTVTIVGHYQNPPSYAGTYGFDGASTSFPHTAVYCCGACPP